MEFLVLVFFFYSVGLGKISRLRRSLLASLYYSGFASLSRGESLSLYRGGGQISHDLQREVRRIAFFFALNDFRGTCRSYIV